MSITVYHGATEIIEAPLCRLGRLNLDFGQGFYVTDLREQACELARDRARTRGAVALLNRYVFDREGYMDEAECLVFGDYDEAWLRFIANNRRGRNVAEPYDYIEGGVADDRVANTIEAFMNEIMSLELALKRLAMHRPNNQMCLRNQQLIDKYLHYEGTDRI